MLSELIIENVAVIEKAHIYFKEGFTCLTGETGAGKSIIIDSINAITGDRLSKNTVRTGAEKASIVAVFENIEKEIADMALSMGYDLSEECIVSRRITADGKSTSRINSVPCPLSVIRTLFSEAINIHGQHDNRNLLNSAKHIEVLDSFGTDESLKSEYRKLYDEYVDLSRQIEKLRDAETKKRNNSELLSFRVQEIERANLSQDEEEELNRRKQVINNARNILSSLGTAYNMLFGSDDFGGAVSALQQAAFELSSIEKYSPQLGEISQRLADAASLTQETGFDLKSYMDDFDVDVSDIDAIEERLDVYYRLKRKYGPRVSDVLAYCKKSKAELENTQFAREKLDALIRQARAVGENMKKAAEKLTENRKRVFENLSRQIQSALEFLNMPFVKLGLSCEKKKYSKDGRDDIEFLISANKGESLKPLSKIASGGELSRIMLAIKNVLASKDKTHTLIFDEIDSGVSGSAALKIGRMLKQTAQGKQVLCVTHSARIASFADNHLLIEKSVDDKSTFTSVRRLNDEERVTEIAGIISGENITETALLNAREMIERSKNS